MNQIQFFMKQLLFHALKHNINHVQCYDCLQLKPSKLQSSNNVFQHQDTQSCDTYVGSTPHFNFFK